MSDDEASPLTDLSPPALRDDEDDEVDALAFLEDLDHFSIHDHFLHSW